MTITAVEVSPWTDRAGWARFVAQSPQGSVFLRPELLDALDVEWMPWRLTGAHDETRAAAIVLVDRNGSVARSPLPFCLYQGVLLPAAAAPGPTHSRVHESLEATTALLSGMAGRERMSWCLHPSFADLRAFSWFHYHEPTLGRFQLDLRYTGLIPVDPSDGLEAVLAGARSVRRREYRKASERFRVEPSDDLDLLDQLHEATFARQGVARDDRERHLLRTLTNAALTHGFGDLFVARTADGSAAGAAVFLYDEHTAYYLVAANDPAFRNGGVSTLLFLSGVAAGLRRGVRAIDVVGMNSPARGDFKTSFGAGPVPYFVANWERP